MRPYFLAVLVFVLAVVFATRLCEAQSKPKKGDEKQSASQKKTIMKEMGGCLNEMLELDKKVASDKRYVTKPRKDLVGQGARMAGLSEAWKPFVNDKNAQALDDMIVASKDLTSAVKPTGMKSAEIHDAVMRVRSSCGVCHKKYRTKEETK